MSSTVHRPIRRNEIVLLDLAHFVYPAMTPIAGYELMVCAGLALYVMAHLVFADVFGRDVLPVGKPWLR